MGKGRKKGVSQRCIANGGLQVKNLYLTLVLMVYAIYCKGRWQVKDLYK